MYAAVWLASCLTASAGQPGAEARALATSLVHTVGPRPSGSEAARQAQSWVAQALVARGWEPQHVPGGAAEGSTVACRAGVRPEVLLLLAHTDTVHARAPGANDNAAAVGVLLEVAAGLPAVPVRTVCLAFPGGEELGLQGSRHLAQAWDGFGPLDQVVALDLVGRGRPTWTGLGADWDAARLGYLLDAMPADVPWLYRAVSVAWPHMERSDHAPFARRGVLASQILARRDSGVDWAYHTARDTPDRLEDATLAFQVEGLTRLAAAGPVPATSGSRWAFVVPWTTWAVPGWLSLAIAGIMAGAGAVWGTHRWAPRVWGQHLVDAGASGLVAWGVMAWAAAGRPLHAALTPWVAGLGVAAWMTWWAGRPIAEEDRPAVQTLAVWTTLLAGGALVAWQQPLLALPVLASGLGTALASRRHGRWPGALLAAWPAGYLLDPETLRELAVHGLVPAMPAVWAAMLVVFAWPVVGIRPPAAFGWRGLFWGLAIVLIAATGVRAVPAFSDTWFEAPALAPTFVPLPRQTAQ